MTKNELARRTKLETSTWTVGTVLRDTTTTSLTIAKNDGIVVEATNGHGYNVSTLYTAGWRKRG